MKKIYAVFFLLLVAGSCFAFPKSAIADGMPVVVINELLWMGSSQGSSDEWIELANTTDFPVDLTSWSLTKLSGGKEVTMFTLPAATIPAHGFYVIAHFAADKSRLAVTPDFVSTGISLVNSKLQITLYNSTGTLVDRADDGVGNPAAGAYTSGVVWKSMERNPTGVDGTKSESWHNASTSVGFDDATKEFGTPGSANANSAPAASFTTPETVGVGEVLQLDASETTDAENDTLTFQWDFGDGQTGTGITTSHSYATAGMYTIHLVANDGVASSILDHVVTVVMDSPAPNHSSIVSPPQSPETPEESVPPADANTTLPLQSSDSVVMSELLPNPDGPDSLGEFVELHNKGTTGVNLRNWKIAVGKKSYVFAKDLILQPRTFLALFRGTTKIALPNTGGVKTFLVDPFGKVIQGVAYKKVPLGQSFALTTTRHWQWTSPTPGLENIFSEDTPNTQEQSTAPAAKKKPTQPVARSVRIADIAKLPRRTKVRVHGVVIVEPGIVAPNSFYIADKETGVQVHTTEATPDLAVGDVVDLAGSVGEAQGEKKVNVANADDVQTVGTTKPPQATVLSATTPAGSLVTLEGDVTQKRATSLSVATNSGTQKIALAAEANLDTDSIMTKTHITITGIFRKTSQGNKVYPRSQDDIVVAKVAGAQTPSSIAPIAAPLEQSKNDALSSLLPYASLLITLLGGAGWLWWKKRKKA